MNWNMTNRKTVTANFYRCFFFDLFLFLSHRCLNRSLRPGSMKQQEWNPSGDPLPVDPPDLLTRPTMSFPYDTPSLQDSTTMS